MHGRKAGGRSGGVGGAPSIVHVFVDVDAAVLVWVGVDAALEVDPLHALGAADGPPAAFDRHRIEAGWGRFLDKRAQVCEGSACLFEAKAVAHDHVASQEKHHSRLDDVIRTGLKNKFLSRVLSIKGGQNLVELEYIPKTWRKKDLRIRNRRVRFS